MQESAAPTRAKTSFAPIRTIRMHAALVVLSLALLGTASAIRCHQCPDEDSKEPFCRETVLRECGAGIKYCAKQAKWREDGVHSRKFCSGIELGNYCDKPEGAKTCIFTCDTDGCNSSSVAGPIAYLVAMLFFVAMLC